MDISTKTQSADTLEDMISTHIQSIYNDADEVYWMAQSLLRDGYLKVSNIVPQTVKELIGNDARSLLSLSQSGVIYLWKQPAIRQGFMSNVRQIDIAQHGTVIPAVYHSSALMDFISKIARERIIPNPWEHEKFIVNSQHKARDTHGYHWGDYPYSMIWIIEAPPIDFGGLLECVPHTYWNKENTRVKEHLLRNAVRTYQHHSGDIYMLKSDTTLHRVTPLERDATLGIQPGLCLPSRMLYCTL